MHEYLIKNSTTVLRTLHFNHYVLMIRSVDFNFNLKTVDFIINIVFFFSVETTKRLRRVLTHSILKNL